MVAAEALEGVELTDLEGNLHEPIPRQICEQNGSIELSIWRAVQIYIENGSIIHRERFKHIEDEVLG